MEDFKHQEIEIDLRAITNVIVKQKKLILSIFLGGTLLATAFGFLLPRTYEATALILIAPAKVGTFLDASRLSFDAASRDPRALGTEPIGPRSIFGVATHKTLLQSNAVIERVIDRLKLTDSKGKKLSIDSFLKKVSVGEERKTSLLQLKALDKVPSGAKDIANAWAQEYFRYNGELILGEIKGTGDFVSEQFAIAKKDLYAAEQKVAAFQDQYKLDLMRTELDMKKGKLNAYKSDLLNVEVAIAAQGDLLRELKTQLGVQDPFIVTAKAITDDALWQKDSKESDDKRKLHSESVNPIYQDLKLRSINAETELNTNRSKVSYLRDLIASTEKDINALEQTLNQKQLESDQLTREVALCKQSYDKLSAKISEARMAAAAQLGEVKLVSPACQPEHARGRLKMILIISFLALVLGVLLAFLRESAVKSSK